MRALRSARSAARASLRGSLGERALLPAVLAEDDSTLVIADGFSCREQLVRGSGRTALHLAEVLRDARAQTSSSPS